MPSQPAAVTQTVERPVRRRRGGSAVEKAISDAVIAELAEVGFGRLTFEECCRARRHRQEPAVPAVA